MTSEKSMHPQSGARLRIEPLERRDLLTGETVIGDAAFVLYDDAVISSTLQPQFSRAAETFDYNGAPVAAGAPRYGAPLHYSPAVDWTDTGIGLPGSPNREILASGWDHDGQTPLMVLKTSGKINFIRGDDFTVVNEALLADEDLMQGEIAGERFIPKAAIIHHGLVVVATVRLQETAGEYEEVGVDFFFTQDYGVSFQRIAAAGGGFGLPIIEEARGMNRLARWAFQNPFPEAGLADTTAVWLPWADYISRTDAPKGGQVGLIHAERSPGTGLWTVGANRLVYSQWIEEDTGSLHAHTAAVTSGGLISHWGDVGYRNHTLFHELDLSQYETAPIQTTFALGDYAPTPDSARGAPQPVAAAPSPVPGGHLAGGDETPEHVLSFGALNDSNDRLDVEALIFQPGRRALGGVYEGAAVLHLQYLQGNGYVAQGGQDDVAYFSPDGVTWTEIRAPFPNDPGLIWIYGDQIIATQQARFWTAPLPTIETINPLAISPGGVNLVDGAYEQRTQPDAGNTVREVTYQNDAWRYADTLNPLDVQAPPPAFSVDTLVMEVTFGDLATRLGSVWLQPTGHSTDASLPHHADIWVANLSTQQLVFGSALGVSNETSGSAWADQTRHYTINDNTEWVSAGVTLEPDTNLTGRMALWMQVRGKSPDSRALVAVPYAGLGDAPAYPIDPLASGPDEIAITAIDTSGDEWSVGFVARLPNNTPQRGEPVPLASLTGPTGDAVVWSLDPRDASSTKLVLDIYDGGQLLASRSNDVMMMRGDWFEFLVSSSPLGSRFTQYISGLDTNSFTEQSLTGLDLNQFRWAGSNGQVYTGVEPILIVADDDLAWSESDHLQWLESSLSEKAAFNARPAPGDFNSDAAVDAADYVYWRENQYNLPPGTPGDANFDTFVDATDEAILRAQYGATGSSLSADFNADGAVNALDYVIWRENTGTQVTPGTGADSDGNGYVEQADLLAWEQAVGAVYLTLDDLRFLAAANAVSSASSETTSTSSPEPLPSLLRFNPLESTPPAPEPATTANPTPSQATTASASPAELLIGADIHSAPESAASESALLDRDSSEERTAREEAFASVTRLWWPLLHRLGR